MTTDRRNEGRLDLDAERGVLVVGGRTAVLDAAPPPDVVVGTYVELVVAQRAVKPSSRADLRDRELDQLAALLALPPGELDALLDRELARLLDTGDDHVERTPRRRVLAFGALGIVAAAAAAIAFATATTGDDDPVSTRTEPAAAVSEAEPPAAEPATSEPAAAEADAPTVETVELPDGGTATRTESAPAPSGDGVDIGTAVVVERQP